MPSWTIEVERELLLAIHACHRGVIDWDKVAKEMGGEFTPNAIRCHMHLISNKARPKKDGDDATKDTAKATKAAARGAKAGKARTPGDPLAPAKTPKSRVHKRSGGTKKAQKEAESSPLQSPTKNETSGEESADQQSDLLPLLKYEKPSDI